MISLATHFEGVTGKRLSAVEADPKKSHQHEFNGVKGLQELFGRRTYGSEKKFPATFVFLAEDENLCVKEEGRLTWYESREAPRSEHRLYYKTSSVTENMQEGDPIVFAKVKGGENILVVTAKKGSTAERQLLWLFSLSPENLEAIEYRDLEESTGELGFADQLILESLGIEVIKPDETYLEEMLKLNSGDFPRTIEFSEFSRSKLNLDAEENPDNALTQWINKEEQLFRAFERHIVSKKLRTGFGSDVDLFISFSLSVHQRRKSRMGHSFENHLSFIFSENKICFSKGKNTEGKKKPDFIFPGIQEYHDKKFPSEKLTMLGAKSTCKDRWRQVCSEAARISVKHLVTLEPGITETQTDEMKSDGVQLIVPRSIQESYTDHQRKWLMSLGEFISLVSQKKL